MVPPSKPWIRRAVLSKHPGPPRTLWLWSAVSIQADSHTRLRGAAAGSWDVQQTFWHKNIKDINIQESKMLDTV